MIPVNNIQYIKASDIERELGIECWRLPFTEGVENADYLYLCCENERLKVLSNGKKYWRGRACFPISNNFNNEIKLVNYVREHFSKQGILIFFD
jgi:hypothetical protein